jgi:CcmD family protein
MGTLAAAFAITFSAVVSYVTWLARQHHRLRLRLDALEAAVGAEETRRPQSRAA